MKHVYGGGDTHSIVGITDKDLEDLLSVLVFCGGVAGAYEFTTAVEEGPSAGLCESLCEKYKCVFQQEDIEDFSSDGIEINSYAIVRR